MSFDCQLAVLQISKSKEFHLAGFNAKKAAIPHI